MDRYHQLIANYGREKKVEQMSNSEDTALGNESDIEELKEGKKIQTKQIVLMVCFQEETQFSQIVFKFEIEIFSNFEMLNIFKNCPL